MRLPFTRGIGGTFPRGCDGHHILVVDCRVAGGTTPRIAPCRLRERRWRAQTENARTRWAGISESRRGWTFSVSGGTGAAVLPLPLRHAPFQPLTCVPTLRPALAGPFLVMPSEIRQAAGCSIYPEKTRAGGLPKTPFCDGHHIAGASAALVFTPLWTKF
jgi:hypothetical protein